ncbi:hypothetical protein [Streptomyces antibioticus]|uniref:hypothetical protein n=1 Tax=Streptomyces antibioticus TaxID=1890 RepID=UPI0036DAAED8
MPRPTERAALARLARRPVDEVPVPVLRICLAAAYRTGDRYGVRLYSRALARATEAR